MRSPCRSRRGHSACAPPAEQLRAACRCARVFPFTPSNSSASSWRDAARRIPRASRARALNLSRDELAPTTRDQAARRHLPNSTGRLLEVGSGTGSNLTSLALAFRGWHIQPSDIDALLLPKIAAAAEQWSNVAAPVCIDAAAPADDWPVEPSFDAILAVNVCHYASPQATRGLVRPRPPFSEPHTRASSKDAH